MNKRVLTRSEEEKKRVVGWVEGVCVSVCTLSEVHTFTHSLLCLSTMLSRKFFHGDQEIEFKVTANWFRSTPFLLL